MKKMQCNKPKKLNKLGTKMDRAKSFSEWEIYNDQAEDIAFEMANCQKCEYRTCKELHDSLYGGI